MSEDAEGWTAALEDQATAGMVRSGRAFAALYKSLTESGVPPDHACSITTAYVQGTVRGWHNTK